MVVPVGTDRYSAPLTKTSHICCSSSPRPKTSEPSERARQAGEGANTASLRALGASPSSLALTPLLPTNTSSQLTAPPTNICVYLRGMCVGGMYVSVCVARYVCVGMCVSVCVTTRPLCLSLSVCVLPTTRPLSLSLLASPYSSQVYESRYAGRT